jgi:large subunit ribosomal protein L16
MLMPKRVKYRKTHRGRMSGKAYRGSSIAFGEFGLQATQPAWVSSRQIEAARVAITRTIKRGGKVWIRVFPDKPVGAPEFWVAVVKPGRVLFEIEGITRQLAQEAFDLGASKLPIKTRFVERQQLGGE